LRTYNTCKYNKEQAHVKRNKKKNNYKENKKYAQIAKVMTQVVLRITVSPATAPKT
jgi:hypothetical protein